MLTRVKSVPRKLAQAVWLAGLLLLAGTVGAVDSLEWRTSQNRVDAQIGSWSLPQLLEQIAESTGWQVYVEPEAGLKKPVSATFKNASAGEALGKLLGDLNYALLPQTNGPARLYVFRTSKDDATRLVRPRERAKSGHPIPNELIVSLKPRAGETIEELAKRLGATITGRADSLNSYRLQFPDEAAARAAREALSGGSDLTVDYNYPVNRLPAPELAIAADAPLTLKLNPPSGSDQLIVGLVDTPLRAGNVPYSEFLLPGLSVAGQASISDTAPTHAEAMYQALLQGSQGGVYVLPVDVYGNNATTSTFDVAKGIAAAINGGASIVNLSLGSGGDSQFLHNVILQAYDKGILVVAAAGNEPTASPTYPAAYSEVVAVTAGNSRTGQISSFANFGSFVDLIAPGSTKVTQGGRTYYVTGTSVSSAYISGFAAGLSVTTGQKPFQTTPLLMQTFGVSKSGK